ATMVCTALIAELFRLVVRGFLGDGEAQAVREQGELWIGIPSSRSNTYCADGILHSEGGVCTMPVMTVKGQVTVPEAIRVRMGWKPGDTLIFEVKDGTVTVAKSPSARELVGLVTRLAEQHGTTIAARPTTWEEQRGLAWREATKRYTSGP